MIARDTLYAMARPLVLVSLLAVLLGAHAALGSGIPRGASQLTLDFDGVPIEVYTYKPPHYAGGPLLLTLHGVGRNAARYRDHAQPLADRHGLLVAAPLFDAERFPTWRYQGAGLARSAYRREAGALELEPEAQWTGTVLLKIVERLRSIEAAPRLPYYLLGHSAGAQALSRIAAFTALDAQGILVANAGSYLYPTRALDFPYGFGRLPEHRSSDESIRRYLAQPLTLLLGMRDVHQDAQLSMREGALAQGAHRYERGVNAYRTAEALARARGWPFGWKLVEVPDVGHSAAGMFRSEQVSRAGLAP